MFEADLGMGALYPSLPCTANQQSYITVGNQLSCLVTYGSAHPQDPHKVTITNINPPGGNIEIFILGPRNPPAGRDIYLWARFYNGGTLDSSLKIDGYTVSANIVASGQDDVTYPIEVDTLYGRGGAQTFNFKSGVTITAGDMTLIELVDAFECGVTVQATGPPYYLEGEIGRFLLTDAVSGTDYDISTI
mmetsp:Transcript_24196/g.21291  ORF Transcript_24196/g.21291 Transcript_24196/m.21291 type:complete len:190 (+) Transcript_24196:1783-2352(+)